MGIWVNKPETLACIWESNKQAYKRWGSQAARCLRRNPQVSKAERPGWICQVHLYELVLSSVWKWRDTEVTVQLWLHGLVHIPVSPNPVPGERASVWFLPQTCNSSLCLAKTAENPNRKYWPMLLKLPRSWKTEKEWETVADQRLDTHGN